MVNNESVCTCETLMSDPFDPATTMTLKLLNSVSERLAEAPVLSRASLRIRFTLKEEQRVSNCFNLQPDLNCSIQIMHAILKIELPDSRKSA